MTTVIVGKANLSSGSARLIKQQQAIFLSRTSAHKALIAEGRKYGLQDEVIAKSGRAVAVSKRGEHLGWAAFLPSLPSGYITEEMV